MASAISSCAGASGAFDDFKVVPPGTGIVHQVNIEYLARVTMVRESRRREASPTRTPAWAPTAHTTMVNGLGVLGWGVGGIEAEAAMLGQPVSMLIPRVVGFKLTGELQAGRHRYRSRADRHRDAAQARRGGQVRRVLRSRAWPSVPLADRATHGQHESRIRFHRSDVPDRRGDASSYLRAHRAHR